MIELMLTMEHTGAIQMLLLLGNNPSRDYPNSCCHCLAITHLDRGPSDAACVWPVLIMPPPHLSSPNAAIAWQPHPGSGNRDAAIVW